MDLGQRIAFFRKKIGSTQAQFAEQMDTTEGTVNRWEQNKSVPRAKAKAAMSALFGVSIDELDEAQSSININEIRLHRATVAQWLKDKSDGGYSLTLVTRTGHFNIIIGRLSKERVCLDVLTGSFDLSDILPLIRSGIIDKVCQPDTDLFERLRSMLVRDTELFDLLRTAEKFESNKTFKKLLDASFVETPEEARHLEKWRQLSEVQKQALDVTIDIKLAPDETNPEELKELLDRAGIMEASGLDSKA